MESVFFETPVIIIGFAVALLLLVVELRTKSTGYVLPVLSVLITVGIIIYTTLYGGTMQEIIIVLLVFVLLNIAAFKAGGGT